MDSIPVHPPNFELYGAFPPETHTGLEPDKNHFALLGDQSINIHHSLISPAGSLFTLFNSDVPFLLAIVMYPSVSGPNDHPSQLQRCGGGAVYCEDVWIPCLSEQADQSKKLFLHFH